MAYEYGPADSLYCVFRSMGLRSSSLANDIKEYRELEQRLWQLGKRKATESFPAQAVGESGAGSRRGGCRLL